MERSLATPIIRRKNLRLRKDWLEMLILLTPAVLLLAVFVVLPTIEAFILSFQREGLLGRNRVFAGFENYNEVFMHANCSCG